MPRALVHSWRSAWWPPTAPRSRRAGAAGSCCWRQAGQSCWSTPTPGRAVSPTCCRRPSPRLTSTPGVTGMPDAVELIRVKRDGGKLSDADIRWLIRGYTGGDIADEQISALLMAIYFRGLGAAELSAWTDAMINSGERLNLAGLTAPTVDKHSTGGVG